MPATLAGARAVDQRGGPPPEPGGAGAENRVTANRMRAFRTGDAPRRSFPPLPRPAGRAGNPPVNCVLATAAGHFAPLTAMTEPSAEPAAESDEGLVAAARRGDDEAFGRLVRRHQGMLAGLLHRFAGRPADVEDLVQETFVRVYRQLPRWRPEAPFVHWLRHVAVNVGRDYCRARARRPAGELLDENLVQPEAIDAQAAHAAAGEVRAVLAQLPPDDCALLTLHFLEGMTFPEIAGHFGWSTVATRVRAFRARGKLQKLLRRHGYEP